ncbi:MAG TPA: FtsX-like permease family protein, partial [Ignavibacteriaceae bacterium]|nr:FtsX-like permease family protein [Ignavibacteriaceae bacterium]
KFYIQPLSDIHLYSHLQTELKKNGNIATIYLYSGVALIILLIACINYINLSTTRLFQRKKEIGIRKVIGAQKQQLIRQFMVESVIITFCAFIITMIITEILLPYFSNFVDRNIEFNLFSNFSFFLFLFLVVVIIGVFSGLFPAITFSSYRPASFFGGQNIIIKKSRLRNILVVVQFVFSAVFIFCSIILSEQLNYVLNKDLGYERNNIITIGLSNRVSNDKIDALKNQLLQDPGIVSVSASDGLPNEVSGSGPLKLPDQPDNANFYISYNVIDYNFINLYGLKIIKGRGFSEKFPSDENGAIILNEKAVHDLGWENPIGKSIIHLSPYGKSVRRVIGVVKDFNMSSLYDKVSPCYLVIDHNMPVYNISIKIKSNTLLPTTFAQLKKQMNILQPGVPFEYEYFNDLVNAEYKSEFNLQKIFLMFSFFTIFIACLGLLGLISFITELRTKEIGIRKTLGASSFQIVRLLLVDIILPIIISGILAFPISYYLMNKWLSEFAYRTEINYGYLIMAVFIICTISIFTMLTKTLKAANRNPVDVLNCE